MSDSDSEKDEEVEDQPQPQPPRRSPRLQHPPPPLHDYLNSGRNTSSSSRRIDQGDTPRYDNAASSAAQQQSTRGDRSLQRRLDPSRPTLDLSTTRRRLNPDERTIRDIRE